MDHGFDIASTTSYTFPENLIAFGTNLYIFSEGFVSFLSRIDLLHPAHLGFFILLIILGMGTRPSFIGEKKREKVDMLYDLKNIRDNILYKPLYIIILFLMAYAFSYVSLLLKQNWYVALFSILGWLSIIAIVSLIVAHAIIILIKTTDEIPSPWKRLPYIAIPVSYLLMRTLFFFYPLSASKCISLLVMIISTVLVMFLLLKYQTNKFKTEIDIKSLMKLGEGKKYGPR